MDRNKAIKIIKSQCPVNKQLVDALEFLIPELKESEDEKIRKNLIELFHDTVSNDEIFSDYGLDKTEVLAWLEKQSKCNTIDVDGLVSKYSKTKDGAWGLPVKCQIKAYRQGINDVLNLVVLNKQCEQSVNILWHDVKEEPEEKLREIFIEWETNDATWHDVGFYRANTKTFWNGERQIEGVVKWAYVDEMLKKQNEPQAKDFKEFINKLSLQFPEVSFAKISRIAVRVKKYLEQCNIFNAQSKDVWHDADETPVVSNRQILVLFKDSDAMVVFAEDWESLDKQLKWAYINDLIK